MAYLRLVNCSELSHIEAVVTSLDGTRSPLPLMIWTQTESSCQNKLHLVRERLIPW